jgi:hypothetical protein
VNHLCGFDHIACEQMGQSQTGTRHTVFNGAALVGGWFFQHPIGHFGLIPGVANADTQSPILIGAELGMDVAQAIVSGVAAAEFEFGFARWDVQLIMNHQDLIGLDLEEPSQSADGFARQVQEGLRLQQPHVLPFDGGACHQAVVGTVWLQLNFEVACDGVYPPKASVVAGGFIVWAWISKANEQLDHVQIIREGVWRALSRRPQAKRPTEVGRSKQTLKRNYFFFLLSPAAAAAS